jgi:hypothetical protein
LLYGRQELLESKQVQSLEIRAADASDGRASYSVGRRLAGQLRAFLERTPKGEYAITFSRLKGRAPLELSSLLDDTYETRAP